MASVEATSAIDNLDARPILPVSDSTVLDDAVATRDHLAAVIAGVLQKEGVRADLLKSEPGNYPTWTRLEAWMPIGPEQPARQQRCQFELVIETKPFNRRSLIFGARLVRGKETIAVAERSTFTDRDVAEWTRYAIGSGPRPSNYRPVLDAFREQLAIFVPPLSRRYNPIERQFRAPRADIKTLLVAAASALLLGAVIFQQIFAPVAFTFAALVVLCAIVLPVVARRYRYYDWVVPLPREAPRRLGHVDSWHAVLVGLGGEAEHLKDRLAAAIRETPAGLLDIRSETFGYRSPNGYEERERLVVSHREGHVHIHIHPLGDNLFVGWQALLNWAQWAETLPLATVDRNGRSVACRDVKASWYYPTEFDLIDLNSLSGLVHGAVEREIKALLTQHELDQAVDFEVIRSDRGNALDARKAWPERADKRRRNSNVIFGWGAVRRTSAGELQLAPIGSKQPGPRRGIATIPAVLLLPVIAVLGYFWLYQSSGIQLYQFKQAITANFPFVFSPMFHLPFAVTLAIGLWLYARVSVVNALMVIALIEALTLCASFTLTWMLAQFFTQRDLASVPVSLLTNAAAVVFSSLCYLLAAAVWVPNLRRGRRWLAAIILWTVWATAATWTTRQLRLPLPQALALGWSLRIFMAACFGFWLWRDDPARSQVSATPDATQRTRTRTRSSVVARSRAVRAAPSETQFGSGLALAIAVLIAAIVAAVASGLPAPQLSFSVLLGLSFGTILALLGVGFVVIFKELGITNFGHGALLTLGAYSGYAILNGFGLGYWTALVAAPVAVGIIGIVFERLLLRGTYELHNAYATLITLGAAFLVAAVIGSFFGASPLPYQLPAALRGTVNVGPMPLPVGRIFVLLLGLTTCAVAWRVFARQGASRPSPSMVFGLSAGLAGLAGVLSAPIYSLFPTSGEDLLAPLFAVVIVAGAGSIPGVIVTALLVGVLEVLSQTMFRGAGAIAPLIAMIAVLLLRPDGLFGGIELPEPRPLSTGAAKTVSGRRLLAFVPLLLVALALVPAMSQPFQVLIMYGMCFALFASAISLLLGQAGILSLGHAMFLAAGAYVAAIVTRSGLPPELAILSSAAAAAVLGVVAGVLVIRKSLVHSAMITAALAQIVYLVGLQLPQLGGEDGLFVVPRLMFGVLDLRNRIAIFYVVTVIFVSGLLVVYWAIHSSFGAALRDMREGKNENAGRPIVAAFALSGAIAGIAGATLAFVYQFVSPELASLFRSTEGVLMVLIGGFGGVLGPVVGAFMVVIATDYLSPFAGEWTTGVVAMALIVVVFLRAGWTAELAASVWGRAEMPAATEMQRRMIS